MGLEDAVKEEIKEKVEKVYVIYFDPTLFLDVADVIGEKGILNYEGCEEIYQSHSGEPILILNSKQSRSHVRSPEYLKNLIVSPGKPIKELGEKVAVKFGPVVSEESSGGMSALGKYFSVLVDYLPVEGKKKVNGYIVAQRDREVIRPLNEILGGGNIEFYDAFGYGQD